MIKKIKKAIARERWYREMSKELRKRNGKKNPVQILKRLLKKFYNPYLVAGIGAVGLAFTTTDICWNAGLPVKLAVIGGSLGCFFTVLVAESRND